MHIPDGYLSPQTAGFFYAVMAPIWYAAARMVKENLNARQIPYLAIGAAFSFVIMMFNIPIPAGSTGHVTGAVLIAILLGPWAACIALTVALVIQALLFGDGGITAIGANCFNMAFIMPFSGYLIYKLISAGSALNSKRRLAAVFIASYVGLNLSAFFTAVEFGLQPLFFHTPQGQALYCPYNLKITIPAMMFSHLLVFGWLEAVVTTLVVKYLDKQI